MPHIHRALSILCSRNSLFSTSVTMFPHPPSPVAENENSPTNIPILHPHYYELRPQPLQIVPPIFYPSTLNFNVAHQVQQEVDQQPDDVASALRGKSPRIRWTDELHTRFVAIVDELGRPWVAKPRHIMMNMEHMGISPQQIRSHLQRYRAEQAALHPSEVGGRKPIGTASFAKKQKKLLRDIRKTEAGENQAGSSIAAHAFGADDQAGSSTATHAFGDADSCNLETLAAVAAEVQKIF